MKIRYAQYCLVHYSWHLPPLLDLNFKLKYPFIFLCKLLNPYYSYMHLNKYLNPFWKSLPIAPCTQGTLSLILTFLINLPSVVSMEFFLKKIYVFFRKQLFKKLIFFVVIISKEIIHVLLFDLHVESLEFLTFPNKYMNRNIHSQMQIPSRKYFLFLGH